MQKQGKDGIAVVCADKVRPLLTDKNFHLKHGFQTVDTAFPYFELLALGFNETAEFPGIYKKAKRRKMQ